MKFRALVVLGLGLFVLGRPGEASATLFLSFDKPSYTIATNVLPTVQVDVFLSQTAGGTQIAPGNALLSAAIAVSFSNPSGIATIVSVGNVGGGPAFDSSSVGLIGPKATLGETSLLGIGNLSSPLLLGVFTFTAQAQGTTTISVATLGPGPSFGTVGGSFLDPTNTATATITVVPEPATAMMVLSAAGTIGMVACWRRRRGSTRCAVPRI